MILHDGSSDFFIKKLYMKNLYSIAIYTKNHTKFDHSYLADLLDMTLDEYISLLHSFNNVDINDPTNLFFLRAEDAQKFADFLNNKYILILRLCGKI